VYVIFIHDTDYLSILSVRFRSGQKGYSDIMIHLSDFKTVI